MEQFSFSGIAKQQKRIRARIQAWMESQGICGPKGIF